MAKPKKAPAYDWPDWDSFLDDHARNLHTTRDWYRDLMDGHFRVEGATVVCGVLDLLEGQDCCSNAIPAFCGWGISIDARCLSCRRDLSGLKFVVETGVPMPPEGWVPSARR